RRLTSSGDAGWVIPEFAWDPGGQRLLWTQNKFPDDVRIDQSCIVRQIRSAFIEELSGVHEIGQIPFDIPERIRDQAVALLRDPASVAVQGRGCGGEAPSAPARFAQETRIGRFED